MNASLRPSPPRIVALTVWAYQRLLVLHPPAFRRAYGPSIVQVFRATCVAAYRQRGTRGVVALWGAALGDVARGAVAEYAALIFPSLKGYSTMQIARRSASVLFGAYIAFVLAGMGFAKLSEGVMQSSLPTAYPILAIAYDAVLVGSVVSLLAILVGGLPVAFAVLRFAWANGRRDILLRFAVPPVALLVIAATLWVVTMRHLGGNTAATIHTLPRVLTIGGLIAVFLAGAILSTAAMLDAIARSDIGEPMLRRTFAPGLVVTITMGVMLLAAAVWSIGLWRTAPALFWGNEGLLATSTVVGVALYLMLMVGTTVVAARALARGTAARQGTSRLA